MTNSPTLACHDERRRTQVRVLKRNGIDHVEVENERQTELSVHLFHAAPQPLENIQALIEGGRRVRDLRVTRLWMDEADPDHLRLTVNQPGDFSTYTLRLVAAKDGRPTDQPPEGFDPRYASAQFSFKVGCPGDLDCQPTAACPPSPHAEPEINYLAKDYASFRQLILDRLSLILPDWRERHVPDLGVALVEVMAYVGDHLSYYQDAVATEAYLDTARRRISVRRHARLVDYPMHDGCNARAWVCIELAGAERLELEADKIWLVAGAGGQEAAVRGQMKREEFDRLPHQPCAVFQPFCRETKIQLFAAHNEIKFHTWGDSLCCLPRGATQATLQYDWKPAEVPKENPKEKNPRPNEQCPPSAPPAPEPPRPPELPLKAGDVLIFEEVIGPKTGLPADADPTHRWAVRLTKVVPGEDELLKQRIVEIEWDAEDALPFPFCLSAKRPAPDCDLIGDISLARGNVLLVDHGRPVDESFGDVPFKNEPGECHCEDGAAEMTVLAGRFEARLKYGPLTFRQPWPEPPGASGATWPAPQTPSAWSAALQSRSGHDLSTRCGSGEPRSDHVAGANMRASASALLRQDYRKARPEITVTSRPADAAPATWRPRRDLLGSGSGDSHFVVEVDDEGRAHLRFGDGELGRAPKAGAQMSGAYRVGNGPEGNVGAESITTLVLPGLLSGVELRPRNPLPAQGGTEPEAVAKVKLFAPGKFRKVLERAITADDYARLVEREFPREVQRAGASLRWTGGGYAVQVAIDRRGASEAEAGLLRRIEHRLRRYRRMGHEVQAVTARLVPLDLALTVCVLPHYLRGHVEAALLDVFTAGRRTDGQPGWFHPDSLTFGAHIYASQIIALAQAVAGVESVRLTRLQRFAEGDRGELDAGLLRLGPLEVAQLDRDPSFPEHGRLTLKMEGGR